MFQPNTQIITTIKQATKHPPPLLNHEHLKASSTEKI